MTTRTGGRHRSTKSSTPPIPPPSLLLVDYLESGQFTGRPIAAPGKPGRKRSGSSPFTAASSPDAARFTGSPFTAADSPDAARFGSSLITPPSRPRIGQPAFTAPDAIRRRPARTVGSPRVGTRVRTRMRTRIGALTRPSADLHHSLRRTRRRPAGRGLSAFRPAGRGLSGGNRRMLPVALAGVAVALSLVGYVLLHPPGTGGSGHHAPSGLTPPPVSVPQPSSPPAAPVKPKPSRPRPKRRTAPPQPQPSHQPQPSTAPVARPASTSPNTAQAPLVVRYLIASEGSGGFQGEISVTNNGTQPISDWRIVVALPDDQVLSFSNASGFVSNGILLLRPGPGAQPIPPGGGQLNVFFVAEGAQTIPQACAFNDVVCS